MRLTVWGARGSIPVSGQQYVRYGGDTTCLEIETASGDVLVLDAGTGMRALGNKYVHLPRSRRVFNILLTHAHWDHLLGFPFFKPLFRKGTSINIHGCASAQESVHHFFEKTMQAPFFPVDLADVAADLHFAQPCEAFTIGSVECTLFPMNHPNGGFGFKLTENGRSLAFFPDNELGFSHPDGASFDAYAGFVRGVDLLIHDAEYLPEEYESFSRGWGHSIYQDTVRLALKGGVGRLLLWHLNQDRDDDGVDRMVARARQLIEDAGAEIPCESARTGLSIEL